MMTERCRADRQYAAWWCHDRRHLKRNPAPKAPRAVREYAPRHSETFATIRVVQSSRSSHYKVRCITRRVPEPDKLGIQSCNHHLDTGLFLRCDEFANFGAGQLDFLRLQNLTDSPEQDQQFHQRGGSRTVRSEEQVLACFR